MIFKVFNEKIAEFYFLIEMLDRIILLFFFFSRDDQIRQRFAIE